MKINITNSFEKTSKKLNRNQIKLVEDAINEIVDKPEIGKLKKGDLAGIRVYKFHIFNQLMLLAYIYEKKNTGHEITLLSLSSHENFYRNLKKNI
jgi:mRNA-degrading endonuclease RelE of RelBE toxin-antitoxin system